MTASAVDIVHAYEAVRAQATGCPADTSPHGLALILDVGLPAWIRASLPRARDEVATGRATRTLTAGSAELVSVLTEMALARWQRCPA